MAAAIFFSILGGLALLVGGYQLGLITSGHRRRELKAARKQLAALRNALHAVEDLALDNPDGFVLHAELLKITRSTTRIPEGNE